jgi:hypothetical protein
MIMDGINTNNNRTDISPQRVSAAAALTKQRRQPRPDKPTELQRGYFFTTLFSWEQGQGKEGYKYIGVD